jgi:DnaJ-class molecular chaperone
MLVNFTLTWNSKGCGRCGGTGVYHISKSGVGTQGVCFKCRGIGRLQADKTTVNARAYYEWKKAEKPSVQQMYDALKSGRFGRAFTITNFVHRAEVAV